MNVARSESNRRRASASKRLATTGLMFAVVGASACVLTRGVGHPPPVGACETVYVTSNGFHTAIAVPVTLARTVGFDPGQAAWVEFGWGEARAYQAERLAAGPALAAVLAPGPSALHIAPLSDRPDRIYGDAATPVVLSEDGARRLMSAIAAEAARDDRGRPLQLGPGKTRGATFVRAVTPYRAWRTCNVWTAERLRGAGVDVGRTGTTIAPVLTRRLAQRPPCPEDAPASLTRTP